ncbi:hypothetical protein H5410_002083 [Solanum commersonii]|uniref:Uncharacterized protein n=1 Tax=Solanum commersonii TaxID=4109 RepID=A0A9J6B0W0_SOLCO|nr:hypothetical protein H5410_002083 [Solanum commersonii]
MYDFTHRFAPIFQPTFVLAHSRSKRSFKVCNGAECKVFITRDSIRYLASHNEMQSVHILAMQLHFASS